MFVLLDLTVDFASGLPGQLESSSSSAYIATAVLAPVQCTVLIMACISIIKLEFRDKGLVRYAILGAPLA